MKPVFYKGRRGRHKLHRSTWIAAAVVTLLFCSLGCNLPRLAMTPTGEGEGEPIQTVDMTGEALPTSTVPQATETPRPTFNGNPPNGIIVFTCSIDTFDQICSMKADGSQITRLTTAAATEFYASIAPDRMEVVFSSIRGGTFQIYGMDMDGNNLRRLSDGKGSLYAPEISPDGRSIVYTYETGKTQNIWVMDRDGANPHGLTALQVDSIDPTWSPDGKQIAFASTRSGSRQLWVMNSDGSNPSQLTDLPNMGGRSSWSPDGTRLAFYAGRQATTIFIRSFSVGRTCNN